MGSDEQTRREVLAKLWDRISYWVVMAAALGAILLGLALWDSLSVQNTLQQQALIAQDNHHSSTASQLTTIHKDQQKIFNLTSGLDAVTKELATLGQYLVDAQIAVCQSTGAQCPAVPGLPGISTTAFFPRA